MMNVNRGNLTCLKRRGVMEDTFEKVVKSDEAEKIEV
jgi:hypothetical protein